MWVKYLDAKIKSAVFIGYIYFYHRKGLEKREKVEQSGYFEKAADHWRLVRNVSYRQDQAMKVMFTTICFMDL